MNHVEGRLTDFRIVEKKLDEFHFEQNIKKCTSQVLGSLPTQHDHW